MVKVHCKEGANHLGPRVMRGVPRGTWRSVDRGTCELGIEPRNQCCSGRRRGQLTRQATPPTTFCEDWAGPAGSETRREHVSTSNGNREIPSLASERWSEVRALNPIGARGR